MQTALVTGSSYGLGKSIVETLLSHDYKVYGVSRSNPLITNPQFVWIKANLTKDPDISRVTTQITEDHLDLLVNNAGRVIIQKTLDFTDEIFDQTFNLNFKSLVKLTIDLFPRLKSGLIINISSDSDRSPDPDFALYGSSKAALNIFFETMAEENPEVKIINVLPSYIDTPLLHDIMDNTDFDWSLCMSAEEVAESLLYTVLHAKDFESGSRIMVMKKALEDGIYNPEKLWVYTTSTGSAQKYIAKSTIYFASHGVMSWK